MPDPKAGGFVDIDGTRWRLTAHAVDRLLEMDIDGALVRECLARPEETYPSVKHPGTTYYRHGDITLACAFDRECPAVLTALWSTNALWEADLKDRPCGDRQLRRLPHLA